MVLPLLAAIGAASCRRDEPVEQPLPPHYGYYPAPVPAPAPTPDPAASGDGGNRPPRPSRLDDARLTALLDECFAPSGCSAISCATLADHYEQGGDGVPRDRIRARQLMLRSCRDCGGSATALGQQTCRAAGVR
jgi:hypothetical protein